jgi:hypothetical protein
MKRMELFPFLILLSSSFTYPPVKPSMKSRPTWKSGQMLDVELLTLDTQNFVNLQDFFTKYKDLLSQLKACGVDKSKEEKKMVLVILSKLVTKYLVLVSTFHSVRITSGAT